MQNNFCNICTKFVRNDNEQKTDHQDNLQKRTGQGQKNCLKLWFTKFAAKIIHNANLQNLTQSRCRRTQSINLWAPWMAGLRPCRLSLWCQRKKHSVEFGSTSHSHYTDCLIAGVLLCATVQWCTAGWWVKRNWNWNMKTGHSVATALGQPMLEMAQRKQYQYKSGI